MAADESKTDDTTSTATTIPSDAELLSLYDTRISIFRKKAVIRTDANNIFNDDLSPYTINDMKSCYPFVHGAALLLALNIFEFKRKYGSTIEKRVYCASNPSNFTIVDFMNRIARNRAIHFLNPGDSYGLRNGKSGYGGWETVGSEDDRGDSDPSLINYMSYDELMISAMSGITSSTRFVNDGARNNCGRPGLKKSFISNGIYMGMIGARFERPKVMEQSLMCVDSQCMTEERGYGYRFQNTANNTNNPSNPSNNVSNTTQTNNNNNNSQTANIASNPPNDTSTNVEDIYASDGDEDKPMEDASGPKPVQNDASGQDLDSKESNEVNNDTQDTQDNTEAKDSETKEEVGNNASNPAVDTVDTQVTQETEEEQWIGRQAVNKKFIDLLCDFYGNVGFIPTYNELSTLYEQIDDNQDLKNYLHKRYMVQEGWHGNTYFDAYLFKIRMRISLELFLFDSDYRTEIDSNHKLCYCHLVGLGLGVWTLSGFKKQETQVFVQCIKDIIETSDLKNIGAIDFSWFDKIAPYSGEYGSHNNNNNNEVFESNRNGYYCNDINGHKIDINFTKRNPADLLSGKYKKYKLCAMYAWDGNALPGNEYYMGSLAASGDPAAACCSTIPYVQNSVINEEYINGENTVVYFRDPDDNKKYKRMRLGDMQKNIKKEDWIQMAKISRPYYNELPTIDLETFLVG